MIDTVVVILSSATAAVGLFAAAQFGLRPDWRASPATALGLFLLLSGLSGLDLVLDRTGVYAAAPALTGILWTTSLFLGPAILAYVLAMTGDPDKVWTSARIVRIGWPAAVAALMVTPFFLLPARTRLAVYSGAEAMADATASLLQVVFVLLFLLLTLGYLTAAFLVLVRHVRRVRDLFSNLEDRTLSWLRAVLLIMLAAWLWGAVKSVVTIGADTPALEVGAAAVELGWTIAIGLFGLMQKPIFTPQTETPAAGKYARSSLPEARQAEIAARLEQAMRGHFLYRDPLLSLSALAARIAITPNHLSQTLNEHLGQSFFDYVNRWRVEEAVTRIRTTDMPILSIAYEVGFNSRSTFNAAVKKHAGQPPSAFRPNA
jgi:AraC-like DNA-binding protein